MNRVTKRNLFVSKNQSLNRFIFSWMAAKRKRTAHNSVSVLFFCLFSIFLMAFTINDVREEKSNIRVGVYDNSPKIYIDNNGEPAGFWVELIQNIAQQEGWKVEWVFCEWDNCLEMLETAQIDLMPDVAWSEERAERFEFTKETVLVNWSRVYVPKNSTIQNILDLDGKIVAGLAGSVNLYGPEGLRDLESNFGISSQIIEMTSYADVMQAVEEGQVDAGITNNSFGDLHEKSYDIQRTPIIFQPTQIKFALPKESANTDFYTGRIDEQMRDYKQDSSSVYYQLMEKFLYQQVEGQAKRLPQWAISLLIASGGLVVLLAIIAITSKAIADQQTRKLRTSESRLSAIFESIPDIIFRYDRDGRFLDFHAKKDQALYVSPDLFLGKTIQQVMPANLADEALTLIRKTIDLKQAQVFEYQLTIDGETKEYESRYSACGKNEAMAIIRDVTQEKQALNKINFKNRLYATLSQINQTIVRAQSRERLFQEICDVAIRFGKFRMAWIGLINEQTHEVEPVVSAGEQQNYLDELKINYLEPILGEGPTGTAVREGVCVVSRDIQNDPLMRPWVQKATQSGFFSTAAVPIRQGNQVIGAFSVYASEPLAFAEEEEHLLEEIGQDISYALDKLNLEYEHNLAMDELVKSEERYQTLADISPVGIFRTDIDGHTTYVNPTWCKISGLSGDKAMGEGWLDAVHPDDRAQLSNTWNSVTQQKKSNTADYRFVHSDGTIVWVIGQAVPEMNMDGDIIGYVGTITDITERKQIEDLRMAVERAEAADKLKSSFLATMSHELRTPLNSIIGFTGIILQKLVGPLSDEQEKQLKMVQGSARHLLDLINDVLDISKIEAGEVEVRLADFNLNESIERSVDKIRPSAEKKGLDLRVQMAPVPLPIYSDQRRVEQVLLNLINNAIKFTEQGQITIKYDVVNHQVITSVTDTGIGIKPEDIDLLFVPFKQIDSGLTRQYEGTGLGLSICKRIIDLLGGEIHAESIWGKGSTFVFSLPLERTENESQNSGD